MPDQEEVKEYIKMLHGADSFIKLDNEEQDKIIFTANELLKMVADEKEITKEAVAYQSVYTSENDKSDYKELMENGIKQYSVKGVSISFQDGKNESSNSIISSGMISPIVLQLITPKSTGYVGRLI